MFPQAAISCIRYTHTVEPCSMDTHLKWAPAYYRHTFSVYGLLTKCEVKMAGYRPSFFFCVFMD